jgi:hypothetical protein
MIESLKRRTGIGFAGAALAAAARMAAVVSEDLRRWSGVVKASSFTVTE